MENVKKIKRKKTKAAEVEHAIRHFIEEKYSEDPELYASFAEILEQILEEFKNNWDKVYEKLQELRERIKNADKEPTYGLSRKKQMPFFRILNIAKGKSIATRIMKTYFNLSKTCLFLGIV